MGTDGGALTPRSRWRIEPKGIDEIALSESFGRPRDLFWMWAGAVWNVEFVVYGSLLVAILGLSFTQAVVVVLGGNTLYLLTGVMSLQGPSARTTTFTIGRAAFGPRGNRLLAAVNWLTQVGFEVVGLSLIVLAAIQLLAKVGLHTGTWAKVFLVVGAVAIQTIVPFVGHRAILWTLRVLAIPFAGLFTVMAIGTASKVNLSLSRPGAGWGMITVALALVISAGGLGWTTNGNDYSRYLHPTTRSRDLVVAVALGGAVPSVLLEILGAALAYAVPARTAVQVASVNGLAKVVPGWFIWPYLCFAIVQLFAINSIDLYSSGVTLQSLGLHLRRYQCVLVDGAVCLVLTNYAILSNRFSQLLTDFLLFIIVWLAPWCSIYLVDYVLRRRKYDVKGLQEEQSGPYFRRRGFGWPALLAQVIGMCAAALWLNAYSPYVSPLSARVCGSDFSIFLGAACAAGSYLFIVKMWPKNERRGQGWASVLSSSADMAGE